MSPESPSHNPNNPPRKRRLVPANTYYYMPYFFHFFLLYGLTGSFACALIDDHLSTASAALLWANFDFIVGADITILPVRLSRTQEDEEGKEEVTLRCPLVGFRACEVELDVEGINKGLYDSEDGKADLRLHGWV